MSSTSLQRVETRALAQADDGPGLPGQFSRDQVDLIKKTVAEGTSDDELALFLEVCRSTGLNPFQRQIYAIMRDVWNPRTRQREPRMTIQTAIDGYRLIAARTGQHVGTSDIEFGPVETDGPAWARVSVFRMVAGQRATFTATARWEEYAQRKRGQGGQPGDLTEMWARMGHTMLGKCAESLALRRAFPAELSGVYTREEMAQATVEDAEVIEPRPPVRFPGASVYGGQEPSGPTDGPQLAEAAEVVEPEARQLVEVEPARPSQGEILGELREALLETHRLRQAGADRDEAAEPVEMLLTSARGTWPGPAIDFARAALRAVMTSEASDPAQALAEAMTAARAAMQPAEAA